MGIKAAVLLAVLTSSAAAATASAGAPIHDLKDKAVPHKAGIDHPDPNVMATPKPPAHNWVRDRINEHLAAVAREMGVDNSTSSPAPKIVGGTPVSQTSKINVFQVALLDASKSVDKDAFFCGGSLYKGRYVVTAAHCSTELPPSQVAVLAGTRELSTTGSGNRIRVTKIKIHPLYSPTTLINDVAVWTLAETVTSIPSAVLAARGSDPAAGTVHTVSGWGNTQSNPALPSQLQSVDLNVVDRAACSVAYNGAQVLFNRYCLAAQGKAACKGDSGGPATTSSSPATPWDTLEGIVSVGPQPPACTTKPAVFSRVSDPDIYDFIVGAAQDPVKAWYQASQSAKVSAGKVTTLVSPICPDSRPTATACQATTNAGRVVGEAFPGIGTVTAEGDAGACMCRFKNVGTSSASATIRCAVFCSAF